MVKRHLSFRNWFNTNYRIHEIVFNVPVFGERINRFLRRAEEKLYGRSYGTYFIPGCDLVCYKRRWYIKMYQKEAKMNGG